MSVKEGVSLGCGSATDLDGNEKSFLLLGYDVMNTILNGKDCSNVCGLIKVNSDCYWIGKEGNPIYIEGMDDEMTRFREIALLIFARNSAPILKERRGIDPRRMKCWNSIAG